MSDQMRELAQRMSEFVPHAAALGLQIQSIGGGRGTMSVAWREDLVGNPDTGVIASGVVTALLDHVCGLAVSSSSATPFPTATLDLRIDYMRPARRGLGITAEAHCYKRTRSIAFVRAEAWDEDRGDLVATAQATFIVNKAPS